MKAAVYQGGPNHERAGHKQFSAYRDVGKPSRFVEPKHFKNGRAGSFSAMKALCKVLRQYSKNTIFSLFTCAKPLYIDFIVDFCNCIMYTDSTRLLNRR